MKYQIEHKIYTDDFGIKRDSLAVIKTNEDGSKIYKPFYGKMKVTTSEKPINDATVEYTQEDYDEMLKEHSNF